MQSNQKQGESKYTDGDLEALARVYGIPANEMRDHIEKAKDPKHVLTTLYTVVVFPGKFSPSFHPQLVSIKEDPFDQRAFDRFREIIVKSGTSVRIIHGLNSVQLGKQVERVAAQIRKSGYSSTSVTPWHYHYSKLDKSLMGLFKIWFEQLVSHETYRSMFC